MIDFDDLEGDLSAPDANPHRAIARAKAKTQYACVHCAGKWGL